MTSRRAIVTFALFASLLVVTAAPASAATVVVSSHDTADEFRTGDIQGLAVTGSGADAYLAVLDEANFGGEEDGSLSEWSGNTGYAGTSNPIAPVGSASIEMRTDGSKKQISRSIPAASASQYSFYVADAGDASNNEILFNASGSVLWGIFANQKDGLYWGEPGDRSTGTPINTSIDASQPHHVVIKNIDPSAGDVEIVVDGISEGRFSYLSSGDYPDSVALNTNTGTHDRFLVDELSYTGSDGGTYLSATHSGTNITTGSVNLTLTDASASVTWQALDGGTWANVSSDTYTSSGIKIANLSAVNATDYRVRVALDRGGSSSVARIESDQTYSSTSAPTWSSTSPSGNISDPAQFSVTLDDADFDGSGSESVTATLVVNGNDQYSETVTSAGTVSSDDVNLFAGKNNYHWRLTDSYGLTTHTDTQSVTTPAHLIVFNATKTIQRVHEVTLTIQFFDQNRVYERTTTDGTVSLAGLPADTGFIVSVQPDQGYISRRAIIGSIYDQQSVYILPESADAAEVRFGLEDPTGQFPPDETTLVIERPITKDGETKYQAVAGDTFGATGSYAAILQTGTRYRLRVQADDGAASRILGTYTVYGPSSETLQIQRIEPQSGAGAGALYGSVEQRADGSVAAVRYVAAGNTTDSVTYRIVRANGSVLVANTTHETDEFADLYPLSVNDSDSSLTVEYWIDNADGSVTSGEVRIGDVGGIAHRFGIDTQALSIISWIAILSTMGLIVIANAKLAPVAGVGMASALSIMGMVAIPMPLLGVSGAISVFVLLGGDR